MQTRRTFIAACAALLPIPFLKKRPETISWRKHSGPTWWKISDGGLLRLTHKDGVTKYVMHLYDGREIELPKEHRLVKQFNCVLSEGEISVFEIKG